MPGGGAGSLVCMIYTPFFAVAMVLTFVAPALAAPNLPLDKPVKVSGIATVCTGIGWERQNDPRWNSYPLKIVFAGRSGQWVTDGDVSIADRRHQIFAAHCEGPWLFVNLPAGKYRISGQLEGQRDHTKAFAPRSGQGRVILRFPKSGGAVSAQHTQHLRALAENRTPNERRRN